jgi:RNA polymerase sigma-70 factor (ECF subfamily)
MAKSDSQKPVEFQQLILAHLDAAYNYAFWLTRNAHDAEDLSQEACARAFAAFDRFERKNPKAWLMTIVRHTFLNQRAKEPSSAEIIYLDTTHAGTDIPELIQHNDGPEQHLLRQHDQAMVHQAIEQLTPEFREVIILRELEDLSYNDIAAITQSAMGTVMSRLSRARHQLKQLLHRSMAQVEHKR